MKNPLPSFPFLFFSIVSFFCIHQSSASQYQRLLSLSRLIIPQAVFCPTQATVLRQHALNKVYRTEPLKVSMLEKAIERFHTTPGFYKALHHYVAHQSPAAQAGYLYEIEKAFVLHQGYHNDSPEDEVILAFHQLAGTTNEKKRQFDLIAWIYNTFHFIECKNSNLSGTHPEWRRQFLDQQSIVHLLSSTECHYCISSAKPIPQKWIRWFELHGIDAYEG